MSLSWSKDDSLFVCQHGYSIWQFDLKASSSSEPLQGTSMWKATYDGRKSEEFLNFLSEKMFLVNRQGRIICSPIMKTGEPHNGFLLDVVLSLGNFGIQSVSQLPLSMSAEVTELRARLNNANADLEKKNNLLNISQREIDSIKVYLAVKNELLKELQSQVDDIVKAAALDEMNKKKKKNAGLKLKAAKFDPPRPVVKINSGFLGFLRRMNRTFVNAAGIYLKFDFIGTQVAASSNSSEILYYCDQDCWTTCPFKVLQFDQNEPQQKFVIRRSYVPGRGEIREHGNPGTWLVNEALRKPGTKSLSCCFVIDSFRFIGQITRTSDIFLNNASVSDFFDQSLYGEYCFVDALAKTYFVLETEKLSTWDTKSNKPPSTR